MLLPWVLLLCAPLALSVACSESSQPIQPPSSSAPGPTPPPRRRAFNPDKPGRSNAERSIGQALLIKRAEEALGRGKPTLALSHLRQALATLPGSPRSAEIYLLMGRSFDMAEEAEQSLAAYEKAAALEPANPLAHYLLARSYKAAKRLDRAYASIRRAVSLAPRILVYRFDRVTIELDLKKKVQGELSFREYEKLRNDYIARLKGAAGAERLRLAAVSALGSVPSDPVNIRALRDALGDKSANIRAAVARALAGSGTTDPSVRKALSARLRSESDPDAKHAIRTALGKLPL